MDEAVVFVDHEHDALKQAPLLHQQTVLTLEPTAPVGRQQLVMQERVVNSPPYR
jgi:hypothetical protein